MYENMTYEMILDRMLDKIPKDLDKREGSIIYNALAPAAIEMMQMYIELDGILNETFADTSSRKYLIKRAAERGIIPIPASNAVLKGVFNKVVPIGSRFSLEELNYIVTRQISGKEFELKCETEGSEGNKYVGFMIPIDIIDGLETAELTELIIPGEDEESTESIRKRYFSTLESQAFGGNISDYKEKVNKIQGVGGVKIYPVWNGGGTVKLVILNSEFKKPAAEFISEVQNIIDPFKNQGKGLGIAPIGHIVSIECVKDQKINIETKITYQKGWSWEEIKNYVFEVIDKYLLELNKSWELNENIIVRISQIESRLLNLSGIIDISATMINGKQENMVLDRDSIAVRGEIIG